MSISRRTYWTFIISIAVAAFTSVRIWGFIHFLRQGHAGGAELAFGLISILLFLLSIATALRIIYVTTLLSRKR